MSLNASRKNATIIPNDSERKMIYDTYDLLLLGKSEADLIEYVRNYESNHIGQGMKILVISHIVKNFELQKPRSVKSENIEFV